MGRDCVGISDVNVVILGESEVQVHFLLELRVVHLVRLRVFPHVAKPQELVGSGQEMLFRRVLARGPTTK